jgi:hypothetical protein
MTESALLQDLATEAANIPANELEARTKQLDTETMERLNRLQNALEAGEQVTYSAQGLSPVLLAPLAVFCLSRLGYGMALTLKGDKITGFFNLIEVGERRLLIGSGGVTDTPIAGIEVVRFTWDDEDQEISEHLTNAPCVLELVDKVEAAIVAKYEQARPDITNVHACGEYVESKIANRLLSGFVL